LVLLVAISCSKPDKHLIKIPPELKEQLLGYLRTNDLPPDQYILHKFKELAEELEKLNEPYTLKVSKLKLVER